MRILSAVILACGLAACSSSSGGGGSTPSGNGTSISGSIGGTAFQAQDAIFKDAAAKGFDFDATSTLITVTTSASACNQETSGTGVAGTLDLGLALATTDALGHSNPVKAAGTFTVVDDPTKITNNGAFAEMFFEPYCALASSPDLVQATTGTVTVTSVNGSAITGTFDVTFESGDHLAGSFDAKACDALDPNRSVTCK